eukprot:6209700-Pleurochrysis_carterae.AAC.2
MEKLRRSLWLPHLTSCASSQPRLRGERAEHAARRRCPRRRAAKRHGASAPPTHPGLQPIFLAPMRIGRSVAAPH